MSHTKEQQAMKLLLKMWHSRAVRANLAHYFQSSEYRTVNGIPTIFNILSAISVLFLSNIDYVGLSEVGSSNYKFAMSLVGLVVVLTTTLQYILRLEEKIYDHKRAGNEFTNIKRQIEIYLSQDKITEEIIRKIEMEHNHSSKYHQLVRKRTWEKVEKRHKEALHENQAFNQLIELDDKNPSKNNQGVS